MFYTIVAYMQYKKCNSIHQISRQDKIGYQNRETHLDP